MTRKMTDLDILIELARDPVRANEARRELTQLRRRLENLRAEYLGVVGDFLDKSQNKHQIE